MPERSDEEMVLRLMHRVKLLIAINDEISVETKLQSQGMLKEFEALFTVPQDKQDPDEVRSRYNDLYIELSEYADLEALLLAMRNFSPYID